MKTVYVIKNCADVTPEQLKVAGICGCDQTRLSSNRQKCVLKIDFNMWPAFPGDELLTLEQVRVRLEDIEWNHEASFMAKAMAFIGL